MKNRFRTLLIILITIFPLFLPSTVDSETIKIVDEQGQNPTSIPSYQQKNIQYINLYRFFEDLRYEVEWNPALEQLRVSNGDNQIVFRSNTSRVLFNKKHLLLSNSIINRDGLPYIAVTDLVSLLKSNNIENIIWNPSRNQIQLHAKREFDSDSEDKMKSLLKNATPEPRDSQKETASRTEKNEFVVMIDPGHGGRDPGAISQNGLKEKKIVLNMAKKLKKFLEKQYPRINAIMTRESDQFIPLEKRTKIANEKDADLFVSLHANSNQSSSASGFSVFTLGGDASDHLAAELAEVENSALRYEGYDNEELNQVQWILAQLMKTVNTRESRNIARIIVGEFDSRLSIPNRGVKKAPFWVLKDAGMPAVLIESGFLSNPTEERKLRAQHYQKRIVKGVAEAIDDYKKRVGENSQVSLSNN